MGVVEKGKPYPRKIYTGEHALPVDSALQHTILTLQTYERTTIFSATLNHSTANGSSQTTGNLSLIIIKVYLGSFECNQPDVGLIPSLITKQFESLE